MTTPIGRMTRLTLAAALASYTLVAPPQGRAAEGPARDAGALDAVDKQGKPLGGCPLRHTDVTVEISGFVARVALTQVFENPFPDPVEAIYTFPLSERAAVDAMTMSTGERTIRGEIKRREEAKAIYEAARAKGQVAALLDQERPNVFTQSLANLMPGARVEIHIEYVEPLKFADGAFELAFPTVVGPRFVPGAPTGASGTGFSPDTDRVPDGSRVTPPVTPKGTRAGHDISIAVDVDAGVPIREVTSPLHAIDVERPSPERARVRMRDQAEIPNRDFVLRYTVAGDAVQSGYLAHRDEDGEGYVTFVLVPPARVTPATAAPKEMIFVIDRSGSQEGAPLEKAKDTMRWILDHMNPNDTFQVIDFGSTANQLFSRPEPASAEMRARARTYIDALEANGGTMMAEAVRAACAVPADAHRLRVVTFMTDGYIGNDFEVIDLVRRLRATSRWFLFGTGTGVNRFLLEAMAREGGGEVDYVLLDSSGEEVAERFYGRIASPVLTDVRLEFGGLDVEEVFPRAAADVWEERPLVVHARYRTPGRGRVVLRGFRGGAPYEQTLDVTLPEHEAAHGAVASMWARAKVEALMAQDLSALQRGTFPEALREQIVSVALAHRLVTQFTSFVAVEDRVVNEGGTPRTVTVPVEMPQGVSYEGVFGADAAGGAKVASLGQALSSSPESFMARAFGALTGRAPAAMPRLEEARPAAPAEARPLADAERSERDAALSARVRGRLAPELQALLTDGAQAPEASAVVDGKVLVEVTLADTSPKTLRALERAGLRVTQVTDGSVLGWVAVERLAALAEQRGVARVELPDRPSCVGGGCGSR